MRIGFVGAGNMAAAMARGWAAAEVRPEAMLFTDVDAARAGALAEEVGGEALADAPALADAADALLLAVKPGNLEAVAAALGGSAPGIISILGGTPLAALAEAFPGVRTVRVMPNVAVAHGRGVLCWSAAEGTDPGYVAEVSSLLGALGMALEMPERLIAGATAIMSCSPAYFALVAEALADGGVSAGLDARTSARLVAETMAGTAELLREQDTLSVRRSVTSPGGSTAAGLSALERGGVRAAFADAVRSSIEKMSR